MNEVPYNAYGQGKVGFPFLGIEEFSLNREAFSVFGFSIYWYAVMIVTGFILAIFLGMRLRKQTSISQDNLLDMILWATPIAVLCARLYYVVMDSGNTYKSLLDVFNIRNGGLAIYGGVIGAVATVVVYCLVKKCKALEVLDIISPCFLLAQGIGRWGNFFNQEAFGKATDFVLGMSIHYNGVQYTVHPTFLYESAWNLCGALLIYFLFKNRKFLGEAFLGYLFWYGLGRAWIEPLRIDNLYIPGTQIAVSEVVAIASVVVSFVVFVICKIKQKNGTLWSFMKKENV